MHLSFLQPWAFLGLSCLAVPIIIHLMERRREQTVSLPTFRFIREAHRRTARRLKIRRWFLLLARLLMILLLTLILARPTLVRTESLLTAAEPTSTVLILDTSPSMAGGEQGRSRWSEALRLGASFAARAAGGGEVGVVTTDGRANGFSRDAGEGGRFVEQLALDPRPADFVLALNRAYRLLDAAAYRRRQIVLFTDLTRPGWDTFEVEKLDRPDLSVPLRLVDLSRGRGLWNRLVEKAAIVAGGGSSGPGMVRLRVGVFGEPPARAATLEALLDGRLLTRRVLEPESGEAREYELELPAMRDGVHRLSLTLDGDPYLPDNTWYGTFSFGGLIRVLTVDGAPRSSLVQSESFFLRAALVPERLAANQRVENTVIFPDQLAAADLEAFDVVILANPRTLPRAAAERLARRVAAGGGLIISCGDNYTRDGWRSAFDGPGLDLLPAWLGETATAENGAAIGFVDTAAPLDLFARQGNGDFSRLLVTRYVAPDGAGLKPGARLLMALGPGRRQPILVERQVGAGRVVLLTTTIDLDWNNFPSQAVYVPLVQRLVEYLAGPKGLVDGPHFTVGDDIFVNLPGEREAAAIPVSMADGTSRTALIQGTGAERRAVVPGTRVAGFHEFGLPGGETPVAVNVTRRESDLRHLGVDELRRLAPALPLEEVPVAAEVAGEELKASSDPSPWFFLLLFAFLLLEGFVSVRARAAGGDLG